MQHNELVRCAVAHAGNDHRLGAQEAPPAIISLYPGQGFEAHVDNIIKGGPLTGYDSSKKTANPGSRSTMEIPTGVEYRNRTAPFPHCGNRFEFRAVGGGQNCSMPVAICNTLMASGMAYMASLLEGGKSLRDAVAQVYKENREIIFAGNGYSAEWPVEAEKRGLPNLKTTPDAARVFNSDKAKAVFKKMGIFEAEEVDARAELMFESYNTIWASSPRLCSAWWIQASSQLAQRTSPPTRTRLSWSASDPPSTRKSRPRLISCVI